MLLGERGCLASGLLAVFNVTSIKLFRKDADDRETEQTAAAVEAAEAAEVNRALRFTEYGDVFPWTDEEIDELRSVTEEARNRGLSHVCINFVVTTRENDLPSSRRSEHAPPKPIPPTNRPPPHPVDSTNFLRIRSPRAGSTG
nr:MULTISPECIES: hypothetical protein [unclassified Rhodococcus (in: high G+C Gram-positive bacteria)]